jgi:predicted esterase
MREHHLPITRTARYAVLGEPGPGIAELWLVLHGYGELAAPFVRQFASLEHPSRLFVAPEGLSRFYLGRVGDRPAAERPVGASWMTREDRLAEIDDYVRYLDAVYGDVLRMVQGRPRLCVCAFSQGTATACRWLARSAQRAERLILWGGELPPDLDLAAARERFLHLDLTLVAGTEDQYVTPKIVARERGRLDAAAIPYRVVTFAGAHEIDPATLRQVVGERPQ